MSKYKLTFSILSLVALCAGFAFGFWPFTLLGLLLAAAAGLYTLAVGIGLLLDLLFGIPVGYLQVLHVPFTLLAVLLCVLYYFLSAYFREGTTGRL